MTPSILSCTIAYGTGEMTITSDETMRSDLVDVSKIYLSNSSGQKGIQLAGAAIIGPSIYGTPSPTVTIVLTELQRVAAIALSNTPGGDGIDPVVADFDAGALKDVGTNPTDAVNGIPVSESADVIVPIVYNGTVNLSTGLVQIFASETIDTTPASKVVAENVFLSNSIGEHEISLSGADIVESDSLTVTMTLLDEVRRARAVQASATPGGDGTPLFLETLTGALRDIAQNTHVTHDGLALVETADTVPPTIVQGAFLTLRWKTNYSRQ